MLLKFSAKDKLWFTSDFHAFHQKEYIWKERGFSSLEGHTDGLVELVNAVVGEEDYLFHLGDLTLNCTVEQLTEFLSRIKCKNICCLWGNHHNPLRALLHKELSSLCLGRALHQQQQPTEVLPYRSTTVPNLVLLGEAMHLDVNGTPVYISHYPHETWNGMHRGYYHLCGHSHGTNAYSHPETTKYRIMDVGVNIGWRIWSWQDIQKTLQHNTTRRVHH